MKPYLIVAGNFVRTGGMDRANLALALYLADLGYKVHAVGFKACSELKNHANVRFHRVFKPLNSVFLGEPLLDYAGRFWASRVNRAGGRVIVNGGNCGYADVNWVHYVHSSSLPRPSRAWHRKLKTAMVQRFFAMRERLIVPRARLVIVPSSRTRLELIEQLGVSPERITVVPLGIDPELFYPCSDQERSVLRNELALPTNAPLICFIGAFDGSNKGFGTLLEAWKLLCVDPSWDASLIVIGDGPDRQEWMNRATRSKLSSRIRFLGFRKDVAKVLRACNAYVLPSHSETYSLATQEAVCCGLPAFVTASSGIAERYPKELDGLLISDPNDCADLVRILKKWQSKRHDLEQLVQPFGKSLREFTWELMAKTIVDLIESSTDTLPKHM